MLVKYTTYAIILRTDKWYLYLAELDQCVEINELDDHTELVPVVRELLESLPPATFGDTGFAINQAKLKCIAYMRRNRISEATYYRSIKISWG